MSKRYNGFWLTHKALRAMLYDAALALQHTPLKSTEASAATVHKLETLLWAFDKHADLEDTYILPLVTQSHPALCAAFKQEHEQDHFLTSGLQKQLIAWQQSPMDENVFLQLFYSFNNFMAFNIAHMSKEESVLLDALWANHTDDALLALHAEIIRTREPLERETSVYWMLKGCNDQEIAQILLSARSQLAVQQYSEFSLRARHIAGEDRWSLISDCLDAQLLAVSA